MAQLPDEEEEFQYVQEPDNHAAAMHNLVLEIRESGEKMPEGAYAVLCHLMLAAQWRAAKTLGRGDVRPSWGKPAGIMKWSPLSYGVTYRGFKYLENHGWICVERDRRRVQLVTVLLDERDRRDRVKLRARAQVASNTEGVPSILETVPSVLEAIGSNMETITPSDLAKWALKE